MNAHIVISSNLLILKKLIDDELLSNSMVLADFKLNLESTKILYQIYFDHPMKKITALQKYKKCGSFAYVSLFEDTSTSGLF
jgi:hypothetical protein